ncbi:MAG: AI-2E family transporter [Alphaproteobacteria bacterium]
MTLQRQIAIWTACLAAAIGILYLLSGILLPFVVGMGLAYACDPLADRLERAGMGRVGATTVIVAVAIGLFSLALVLLVPLLVSQIGQVIELIPAIFAMVEKLVEENSALLRGFLGDEPLKASGQFSSFAAQMVSWAVALLGSLWSGGAIVVGTLSLLVVTPVVAFYLLVDWDRMVAKIDGWLPLQHAAALRGIARDIDKALAGFVRGQGTVCLVLGGFYALALTLAGLQFGLLIGLIAGLASFIPYVGSILGFAVSVGMAIAQTWPNPDWIYVAIIAAIFGVGQFFEGNILSPRLVGNSVGLHPVWLMFALFAFGFLFGFVGLLLAVPVAASIGVVSRFLLKQYLASQLYLGGADTTDTTGTDSE